MQDLSTDEESMPLYQPVQYDQTRLIPVSFSAQIFPGTFEHTLNQLVDHGLDLSIFDSRYHNDARGAPAWHPAVMLKIILYAYSGRKGSASLKTKRRPEGSALPLATNGSAGLGSPLGGC
jgi:transposase